MTRGNRERSDFYNKGGMTFVLDRATREFIGVFPVPELQNRITHRVFAWR